MGVIYLVSIILVFFLTLATEFESQSHDSQYLIKISGIIIGLLPVVNTLFLLSILSYFIWNKAVKK